MAKPSDTPPDRGMGIDPVTPGPEITIDAETPPPDAMSVIDVVTPTPLPLSGSDGGLRTAVPPPDYHEMPETPPPLTVTSLDGRGAPREPFQLVDALSTPRPLPPAWAAQPLAPMQDEATVPLPVEEVEFAGPEGNFGERVSPAALAPPEAPRSPPTPPPARPPLPATPAPELGVRAAAAPEVRGPESPRAVPPPAPQPAANRSSSSVAPAGSHPLLPPGATWQEALSQRPRKKRLKPWFEEAFDEDYLRTLPFLTPEQTLREVDFLRDSFRLPHDAELLDVGCGYGRHAIELGQGGYRVTGIDLSLPLLIRAADEAQRRSLSVNFVHADMREMAFDSQFDGAYSFLTSFGYFDEETNLKVAASVARALRPGGRFLLDTLNRDYIVGDLPTRVWWEGEGCVVLEEVDFNYQTSRLNVRRSIVFQDGRQVEHEMSIRAYSLHELGKLLRQAGFRILEVSGSIATRGHFFGAASRSVMVLCERPAD